MTLPKYITETNREGVYGVRVPNMEKGKTGRIRLGTFPLKEAIRIRDLYLLGFGVVLEDNQYCGQTDFFQLLDVVSNLKNTVIIQDSPDVPIIHNINLPSNKPFGICFLSDLHIGGKHVDYTLIGKDIKTIMSNPNIYVIGAGDFSDNWVVGKLMALQREQLVPHDVEWRLVEGLIETIAEKLLCVVGGNHDAWTESVSGVDRLKELINKSNSETIYESNEARLVINGLKIQIRHKWKRNSSINPTYCIEKGYDDGDWQFDIGVGGHTHIATLCRPFYRHDKLRQAIILSTYKRDPKKKWGSYSSKDSGCGLLIVNPDKATHWFSEVDLGNKFLNMLVNNSL